MCLQVCEIFFNGIEKFGPYLFIKVFQYTLYNQSLPPGTITQTWHILQIIDVINTCKHNSILDEKKVLKKF